MSLAGSTILDSQRALGRLLEGESRKDLLRFITCGSVDDGKSTLIGRLLYETQSVSNDQLEVLTRESRGRLVASDGIDYSLLVDGLQAEREQGITIDVAYRYFSTDRRKFIVADTPGHEQYTRNMATGASTADLAILLIDARKGVLTQTRRHAFICSFFGIRQIVAAVNKMDLVGYDQQVFSAIAQSARDLASELGISTLHVIPVSALNGDNVVSSSDHMDWYTGPTLLSILEGALSSDAAEEVASAAFRFPVQLVNRVHPDFRGFSGTIASGTVQVGDRVLVPRSGNSCAVRRIVTIDADLQQASAGEAITIELSDEIDISRGDVLSSPAAPAGFADHFQAKLLWTSEKALIPGRSYLMRIGTDFVPAAATDIKYRVDVNSFQHIAAKTLQLNELAVVNIATDRAVAFDRFLDNRSTGAFILIDRVTNETVGMGTIDYALRRSNIAWQHFDIDRATRKQQMGHTSAILWLTGLSGAGKSTIANCLERQFCAQGKHAYILDGDNVRHGLNKDLGFTEVDRVENIRRVAEVARLMADAGLIVIVSFISPYRRERQLAREIAGNVPFFEIFVDTPIEVCEARDAKGLYARARAGMLQNFTGIDAPYEAPLDPDVKLHGTAQEAPEALADTVLRAIAPRLEATD